MKDDLVSLKVMIVSEAASERDLVRRTAEQASLPVEIVEVAAAADAAAARTALGSGEFDVVFCDSRMPKSARQHLLDATRAAASRPLTVLIGAAELKTREVLTDGLPFDGVLAKPIDAGELQALIGKCLRARVPSQALIVDDSQTVRSVIRKVLQASRFRFNVQEAAEGSTAVEQAGQQRYDIVFLDCHMPGVDGFATLGELKRILPNSKVVMITGTRDARIEDRARAEGASDFLYKPFFANDIDAVLSRLFGLMRPRWN